MKVESQDFLEVSKIGFRGYEDPKLLEWAAEENRLIITHDAETMTKFAYERVVANLPMPGVILVPGNYSRLFDYRDDEQNPNIYAGFSDI
jgi:predicted nuclease of predicted toxin-antitoxin system